MRESWIKVPTLRASLPEGWACPQLMMPWRVALKLSHHQFPCCHPKAAQWRKVCGALMMWTSQACFSGQFL